MPRAHIRDVADLAGVSISTVSHALSGRRPVSFEVRRRVEEAAKELDYRPNPLARGLRSQTTQTIALVVPDIANPFYPDVLRGVQESLDGAGYQVIAASTSGDAAREASFLRDMVARSVDGMIVSLFRSTRDLLGEVTAAKIPVVSLGLLDTEGVADRVHGDDRVNVAEVTRRLIGQGRGRIAYLGAAAGSGGADARRQGYEDALLGSGRPLVDEVILERGYARQDGIEGVRALLGSGATFDALVCVNDLVAIGAMTALREAGVSVPDDVAVVGFDNIEAAELVHPTLTTIDNRAIEKGRLCGQLLLQRMTGELAGPYRDIVVPGRLVVRDSA